MTIRSSQRCDPDSRAGIMALVSMFMAGLLGLGCSALKPNGGKPLHGARPAIESFTSNAHNGFVTHGSIMSLTAVFSGGNGSIDQGIGPVTSGVAIQTPLITATTTYTLTVTNPEGTSAKSTKTFTVVEVPDTTITAPYPVTAGASGLTASVPAQAGNTYSWAINGGGTITAGAGTNAIQYTAAPSGYTGLDCTVTNPAGMTQQGHEIIVVVPVPESTIEAANPVTRGSRGLSASVVPQPGATYAWSITGGGAITWGPKTNAITYTAPGYAGSSVALHCTVTNAAGLSSTSTKTISVVAAAPAATIDASTFVTAGSQGLSASVPFRWGATYAWNAIGTTITAGNATRSITYNASKAPISLTCAVTDGGITVTGTKYVNVVAAPDASITANTDLVQGMAGYHASVPYQTGVTYAWSITNGTITLGNGTNGITFTVGHGQGFSLDCVVTNQAGTAAHGHCPGPECQNSNDGPE